MNQKRFLIGIFAAGTAFTSLPATLHAQSQAASPQSTAQRSNKQTTALHKYQALQDEGHHIFEQNCSRCHNAPEGFSSNISGTIVRHMRVRASLSQHDEEELLRFLNP